MNAPTALNQPTLGLVSLVGAGPGDPELLTIKGMTRLQQAHTVVYDRLANPVLLNYAPRGAALFYAGKAPRRHRLNQESINQLLISQARSGRRVVRLKGGDPFVFGRGGEEAVALAAAGIPFEVVPGVTSAIGVPAYAGIPVTQRHIAQSVTIVTGHTADAAAPAGVDWEALPLKGTLVILMGVSHLPEIAGRLIAAGHCANRPVATIQCGTVPEQRVVVGTLRTIAHQARDIRPPAITVVGEVVALRRQIDWFQRAGLAVDQLAHSI